MYFFLTKPSLPDTPTTRKPLHRTLSDESIYSGQREPSYCTSHLSLLDQALPNDVIFSSTYPSLHYTLPGRKHGQSIKSHHVWVVPVGPSSAVLFERSNLAVHFHLFMVPTQVLYFEYCPPLLETRICFGVWLQ